MTFEPWENGVTEIDEEHVNQLIDVWNNLFGVTGPNPTRLSKLPIPVIVGTPGGPIAGEFWLNTDIGGPGGVLQYHDDNGNNVPLRGGSQIVYGDPLPSAASTNSVSFVNITDLTVDIIPTTGRLRFRLAPPQLYGISDQSVFLQNTVASAVIAQVRVVLELVGSGDIATLAALSPGGTTTSGATFSLYVPPSAFVWDYDVPGPFGGSGLIRARVQAAVLSTNMSVAFTEGMRLVAEEVAGI